MASFEQIIKFENEKPHGAVRLVEANGFYRAYNHSAYLFHQAIAKHKVTKKFVKNICSEVLASVSAARSVIAPYQNFSPVAGLFFRLR